MGLRSGWKRLAAADGGHAQRPPINRGTLHQEQLNQMGIQGYSLVGERPPREVLSCDECSVVVTDPKTHDKFCPARS